MALDKQQKKHLPSTLERSPQKAQDTYIHTLESAEKTHGDGEAAHRIALSSLKHSFEKVAITGRPKVIRVQATPRAPKQDPTQSRATRRLPVG